MTSFHKRTGTVNKGSNYEDLNLASFVLKLVNEEKIKNFYVSSNDRSFGSFDDIVVETETEQVKQTYAMQLKHTGRSTLSIQQLQQDRGDFSIKKYFASVQNLKSASVKFILYTNLRLNVGPGVRFQLDGESFEIELLKFYPNDVFKISDTTDYCYKFRIVDDSSKSAEILKYKEFFENFFLYDDQENNDDLNVSLKEKFKRMFLVSEIEFDQYFKLICEWSMQKGKIEKFDKRWMQRAIALQILAPRIRTLSFGPVSQKMKIFRETIWVFDVTVVAPDSYDDVKVLWGDLKSKIQNEKETNKLRTKYRLWDTSANSCGDVDNKVLSTLLWLMGKCPLIVTEDDTTFRAMQLCSGEKFILIGEGSIDLKKSSVFKNLSDLKLHNTHYEKLIKSLTFSIQGKEEMTLETLVQENNEFLTIIKTDYLLQMLNTPCNVGEEKETLPEPYIFRCLLETVIDLKFLGRSGKDNLIILDGVNDVDEIKTKFKYHHFVNIDGCLALEQSNLGSTIYFSRRNCSPREFEKLCNKNSTVRNWHQFRLRDDGNLKWIRTKGDLSDLENYKLDDLCAIEEKELWSSEPENKINIILADPGMGKSELTKSLKNNSRSKFWAIIIYPKDIYSFFKNSQNHTVEEFDRFLLHEKYGELKERDKEYFRTFVKLNKVIYIWDAVDELLSDRLDVVTNIILQHSEEGRIQWVTSRCHLKKKLETKFTVLSRKLNQFGEKEQVFYIEKRLIGISSETVEEVIEKIQSTFVLVEHKDILGIPLQIFMLTELFRQNRDKYFGLLTNAFTLSDLYRYFIEEKFNIYYAERMRIDYQSVHLELLVKIFQRDMTEIYETVALKTVFPDEILKKVNINFERELKKVEEGHVSIGLVTELPNQIPRFVHISFAEYFVAVYISKNLAIKDILADIIFDYKFVNVRFFLDLILANKSPLHVAVLYKNFSLLKEYEDEIPTGKDEGGRSVLHLACSWGQRHPLLQVHFFSKAGRYNVNDNIPVNLVAENEEYSNMLDYLLDKCSITEEDNLFAMTPLSYAQKGESLAAEIKILKKLNGNIFKSDDETSISHAINILYYSARFGYCEAMDLFIDKVDMLPFSNTVSFSGKSLLYMACANGYLEIAKCLIVSGAKINFGFRNVATPLIAAAKNGHLEVVKFLLSFGADANRPNHMGATPLHMASFNGHYGIVKTLVKSNAAVMQLDCDGNTPLFVASFSGNLRIVKFLAQSGSEIDARNSEGATALFTASQVGHLRIVKFLVESGARINLPNHKGASPLFIASQNGHKVVVNFLVASGAEINGVTSEGATPLLVACQNGHLQIAESLIASGGDFNLRMRNGVSPLFVSCQNGHEDIVKFLITSGVCISEEQGIACLLAACYKGYGDIVKVLVRSGVNVNRTDPKGITPLMLASYIGDETIVRFLLSSGANVNSCSSEGITALHVACYKGHYEILKIFLKKGSDVNAVNENGATSLFLASQNGYENIVDMLLESGADSNLANNQDATPLFIASQNGHLNIVKSLVKFNGNISLGTQNGATPFLISCQNGYDHISKFLFDSGANINCVLYDGITPLIVAARNGDIQITRLLIILGADVNLSSNSGNTPLFVASFSGHLAIVKLLVEANADINRANDRGFTPLVISSVTGHREIVDFLLRSGGCVNVVTNIGTTPLFAACQNGHLEVAKSLVAAGAKINLSLHSYDKAFEFFDVDGFSKRHLVFLFAQGHKKIAEYLIESGVEIKFA